jgi:hypothetical protein
MIRLKMQASRTIGVDSHDADDVDRLAGWSVRSVALAAQDNRFFHGTLATLEAEDLDVAHFLGTG